MQCISAWGVDDGKLTAPFRCKVQAGKSPGQIVQVPADAQRIKSAFDTLHELYLGSNVRMSRPYAWNETQMKQMLGKKYQVLESDVSQRDDPVVALPCPPA